MKSRLAELLSWCPESDGAASRKRIIYGFWNEETKYYFHNQKLFFVEEDSMRDIVGHSFISTVGGRFGLATPGCKSSDQVCVFYGGHPLCIIRPHADNDSAAADSTDRL